MEELPNVPNLRALEEMINDQQWNSPFMADDDEEEDTYWLIPDVPPDFRPAA